MFKTRMTAVAAAATLLIFVGAFAAAPSRAWELSLPTVPEAVSVPIALPEPALESPVPAPAPDREPAAEHGVPRSLAELVRLHGSGAARDAEEECLAGAVYFEAKGEPLAGQLSVAEVILNRAKSGRFPSTACGVVKQRGQFSFVRGGRFPPIARASAAWRKAVAVARVARDDLARSPAGRALFFHARRVSPGWRGLTRIASVGNHVFYR